MHVGFSVSGCVQLSLRVSGGSYLIFGGVFSSNCNGNCNYNCNYCANDVLLFI